MSKWGSNTGIVGWEYPGSHVWPESVELKPFEDAVDVATINIEAGELDEPDMTSRLLRLSVVEPDINNNNPFPWTCSATLLDMDGVTELIRQLLDFMEWRIGLGDPVPAGISDWPEISLPNCRKEVTS